MHTHTNTRKLIHSNSSAEWMTTKTHQIGDFCDIYYCAVPVHMCQPIWGFLSSAIICCWRWLTPFLPYQQLSAFASHCWSFNFPSIELNGVEKCNENIVGSCEIAPLYHTSYQSSTWGIQEVPSSFKNNADCRRQHNSDKPEEDGWGQRNLAAAVLRARQQQAAWWSPCGLRWGQNICRMATSKPASNKSATCSMWEESWTVCVVC